MSQLVFKFCKIVQLLTYFTTACNVRLQNYTKMEQSIS